VALHPSGDLVLVGFSDKLRLMAVLLDDLKAVKELAIRGCRWEGGRWGPRLPGGRAWESRRGWVLLIAGKRPGIGPLICAAQGLAFNGPLTAARHLRPGARDAAFSHGGHLFAAANGVSVGVYNTYTAECVCNLRGHNSKVGADGGGGGRGKKSSFLGKPPSRPAGRVLRDTAGATCSAGAQRRVERRRLAAADERRRRRRVRVAAGGPEAVGGGRGGALQAGGGGAARAARPGLALTEGSNLATPAAPCLPPPLTPSDKETVMKGCPPAPLPQPTPPLHSPSPPPPHLPRSEKESVIKGCVYNAAVATPDNRALLAAGSDGKIKELEDATVCGGRGGGLRACGDLGRVCTEANRFPLRPAGTHATQLAPRHAVLSPVPPSPPGHRHHRRPRGRRRPRRHRARAAVRRTRAVRRHRGRRGAGLPVPPHGGVLRGEGTEWVVVAGGGSQWGGGLLDTARHCAPQP
jgi:hypothetical protein